MPKVRLSTIWLVIVAMSVSAPAYSRDPGIGRLEKALKGSAKKFARVVRGKIAIADLSTPGQTMMSSEFGQVASETLAAFLLSRAKGNFSLIDRRELIKAMQDSAIFGDDVRLTKAVAEGAGAEILISGTYTVADSKVVLNLKAIETATGKLIMAHTASLALSDDLRKMASHKFQAMGPPMATGGEGDLLELDVGIYYEGGNGKLYPIREGMVLTSNDNYAIHISAPGDCYVYIYQTDSAGRTTRLYPNDRFGPLGNPVPAGSSFWVPNGNRFLFLDAHPGKEEIVVFATKAASSQLGNIETAQMSDIHRQIATMGVNGARERPLVAKLSDSKRTPIEGVIRRLSGRGEFYFRVAFFHQD